MLSCNIGNYLIKRQSERYVITIVILGQQRTRHNNSIQFNCLWIVWIILSNKIIIRKSTILKECFYRSLIFPNKLKQKVCFKIMGLLLNYLPCLWHKGTLNHARTIFSIQVLFIYYFIIFNTNLCVSIWMMLQMKIKKIFSCTDFRYL